VTVTYKVDTDNQLGLGAALARNLCHGAVVERRRSMRRLRRSRGRRSSVSSIAGCLRRVRRVSRRTALGRIAHLLLLRGVAWSASRVYGRQWAVGAALSMLARRESSRRRIRVRGRATEGILLGVHGGQRGGA
jgi:hypothetical protein